MLLATCVNTPIYCRVFHNLQARVARCSTGPKSQSKAKETDPEIRHCHEEGDLRLNKVSKRLLQSKGPVHGIPKELSPDIIMGTEHQVVVLGLIIAEPIPKFILIADK